MAWKKMCTNLLKWKKISKQLKEDNKEMKTKLEKSMSEKFRELDNQIVSLENKITKVNPNLIS